MFVGLLVLMVEWRRCVAFGFVMFEGVLRYRVLGCFDLEF